MAKYNQKTIFFNVEKLIIKGKFYRGLETKKFPFYGRLMEHMNACALSNGGTVLKSHVTLATTLDN